MLSLQETTWEKHEALISELRDRVFVTEQGIDRDLVWDSQDPHCQHVIAFEDYTPVGSCRILSDGSMGRFAVLPRCRGQGIGSALLDYAIAIGRRKHQSLVVHAQLPAQRLYQRAGFQPEGEVFREAGLDHRRMSLSLGDHEFKKLHTLPDYQAAACHLVRACREQVRLFCTNLDSPLYDNDTFVDSISCLARRHRHNRVRILIKNSELLVEQGHRVLELSRRLSSRVTIRLTPWDAKDEQAAYLMGDDKLLLYKADDRDYQGFVTYNGRSECQRHIDEFDHMWEHGQLDPGLRRLGL